MYFSQNKSAFAGIENTFFFKMINKLHHGFALIHMIMCKGPVFCVEDKSYFFSAASATVHSPHPFIAIHLIHF